MSATILRTDLQGLPQLTTSLIGRDELIEHVTRIVQGEDTRLLTLLGSGGIGKTRTAIAVAETSAVMFPDGVTFVSLATTPAPELVASTIATTLGVTGASDDPLWVQIAERLRGQAHLLVVDNFEHVLDAAPSISWLLSELPDLTVLVTSRSPLRLRGERIIEVPPLSLPEDEGSVLDSAAVRLFLDRAGQAEPGQETDADALRRIAEICRRLDGLPLAIELAAAGERPQSVNVLWSEGIDTTAPDPGHPDARQRTMSDAVAWSYNLLQPEEQLLFRRLSGFTAGFSIDAVSAVSAALDGKLLDDPIDLLVSLIEQSLVLPLFETGGEARGSMLQTISEFGREALQSKGEEIAFSAAHARWFLEFALRAEPGLRGNDQTRWVQLIDADLGNIRSAIEWFQRQGDAESALRLTSAIGWYWSSPGHFHEGRDLYDRLLAMPAGEEASRIRAKALESAGDIEDWLMNLPKAEERYEEAAALCRQLGDIVRLTSLTRGLGSIALGRNDPERAAALFIEAIENSVAAGDPWNHAAATNLLGVARFAQGAFNEAIALCTQAMNEWQELGDPGHVIAGASTASGAALAAGEFALAYERADLTLTEADRLQDAWYRARAIAVVSALLVEAGRASEGTRLMAHAEAVTAAIGTPVFSWVSDLYAGFTERARQSLGDALFTERWNSGIEITSEDAVTEAKAALASLTGHWPQEDVRRSDLSRREIEVLTLLAQGKTDREIADELFIERRTVSKHVAAILAKLGVPNRSAAASTALRLGLV